MSASWFARGEARRHRNRLAERRRQLPPVTVGPVDTWYVQTVRLTGDDPTLVTDRALRAEHGAPTGAINRRPVKHNGQPIGVVYGVAPSPYNPLRPTAFRLYLFDADGAPTPVEDQFGRLDDVRHHLWREHRQPAAPPASPDRERS